MLTVTEAMRREAELNLGLPTREEYTIQKARAVREAIAGMQYDAREGILLDWHLYCRPGELTADKRHPGDGWKLVTSECIPPIYSKVSPWIESRAQKAEFYLPRNA